MGDSSRWGAEAGGQQVGEADAWDDLLGPAVSVHRDPEFPADGREVEGYARRTLLHVLHDLQQQVDFSPARGGPHASEACIPETLDRHGPLATQAGPRVIVYTRRGEVLTDDVERVAVVSGTTRGAEGTEAAAR